MNGWALYRRLIAVSFRAQMQYRASFIMATIGHLFATGIEFLGMWALFDRFGSIGGWSLPEVALFYGLVNVAFALADAVGRGFDLFAEQVKAGDFDRLLLRPRDTVLQLLGHELTLRRVGRIGQGLVVFLWAQAALGLSWDLAAVVLAVLTVAGTALAFLSLYIVQGALAFWTSETLEIMNTLTYGGVQTAQYPISIYRRGLRLLFTFVVPLACVTYWPVVALLGRADPLGTPAWLGWVSPLAALGILAIALALWRTGVRRYTSTGS